ncbi:MAG: SDR family NAD(P)-dependent oxidoreductase, partial [Novosphingobium sp.]|nr:SDR family NAD(P)-dependent oxidoreductase [Novosphingobium sp.]
MGQSNGRLSGKVAIVTGAGQGIGAAIAAGYAREGARVLITGRTMSKLEEVAGQGDGEIVPFEALAGNKEHAEKTVAEALSRWGRVDILVNNAHTFTDYLPIEDPKMEEHCMIDMQSAFIGSLQL